MDECSNLIYDETGGQLDMGQSDSKGARKRSNTPSGKGAAMSFGFRKRSNGSKNAAGNNGMSTASNLVDKNGNGGSTEELFTGSPILSGRSTPLARPRKENSAQPLRTNRQSTIPKTAKVGDINMSVEQALTANQETKNNNINDKFIAKNSLPLGLIPTQIGPTGLSTINPQPPRPQTKQTVILTYSAKQQPIVPNNNGLRSKSPAVPNRVTAYQNYGNQRSVSASRAYTNSNEGAIFKLGNLGKYTFQTNQLPKPQYPAVKVLDAKTAKQVANNNKKVCGSSDGSSKEGSVTGDSGVSGLGENNIGCPDRGDNWSPQLTRRLHRRPRTLEMIMQGEHNFHLRELHVNDLDIMDEAVITDNDVIPLPKLPSTFDKHKDESPTHYFQIPENRFNLNCNKKMSSSTENQENRSHSFTLERYMNEREISNRSISDAEDTYKYKGEEKASRDRIQHEKPEKQDYGKMTSSNEGRSSLTRDSSKESSPSTKSEEPSLTCSDPLGPWMNQNAGESMALRSQDDMSAALSLSSSCESEKYNNKATNTPQYIQATLSIVDKDSTDSYASLTTHPMMLKSLSLSQPPMLPSILMTSSMTSSAFSTDTSNSLIGNELHNLIMGDSRLRIAALNSSNHSLIEDETSPADSLISSSTDSNNEIPVLDKDVTMSSSAYHTADNKTIDVNREDDTCMEDNLKDKETTEKSSPKKKSNQHSPDTPTNASNSLSLSEGRDFLIDDEIADQPALIFEANSIADQQTSSLQLLNLNTDTPTLQEANNHSIANKLKDNQKVTTSPLMRPKRTSSLDTLSPCDSIASDDLIMDMDLNHSITSLNSVDEYIERLDGSIRSGLNSLEDKQLREELLKLSLRKHSSQILTHETAIGGTPRHQTHSNSTSNSSLVNIGANLPLRTGRLLTRSRADTPDSPLLIDGNNASPAASSVPGGTPDDAIRIEKTSHSSMLHDIVTIKTMLLKLKRVLQEPSEDLNLTRTETLNPLDNQRDLCPLKNGPSLKLGETGEASPPPPPPAPHEEVADLRRQLVFLQSQLEDRERLVKLLQQQMSKYSEQNASDSKCHHNSNNSSSEETCNVATQTDRFQPLQRPTIFQNLTSDSHHPGSIISWNEQNCSRSVLSSHNPHQSSSSPTSPVKKSVIYSPVNSDCETAINNRPSTITNGYSNGIRSRDCSPKCSPTDSPVYVKSNCKVGNKYLEAISNKQNDNRLLNGNNDLNSNKIKLKTRSKSIENFRNHNLHPTAIDFEDNYPLSKKVINNTDMRGTNGHSKTHHKSYTNLFSGEGKNNSKMNGYHSKRNGYANGSTTDTDDNSDSGYKSLPSSINLPVNKMSGIPRRTITSELKTFSSEAQTNKC